MIQAQPASATVTAFNDALRLFGDDVEGLQRAAWQFRGLFARNRSDTLAAMGLLHVQTMLGGRDEAVLLSDELWGRRNVMPPDGRLICAYLESSIGHHERALELTVSIHDKALRTTNQWRGTVRDGALALWRPDLASGDSSWLRPAFNTMQAALEEGGLLPHIADRQALVNDLLTPVQCGLAFTFGTDGGEGAKLIRTSYVAGSYADRRALSDRVSEALSVFYQSRGVDESLATDLLSEVVLPVTARAAAMEEAVMQAA